MKNILILSLLLICSCSTKTSTIPNWIIGNWERINDKPNEKTYEFWTKNHTGLGFTLKVKDTIFKENLEIIALNDSLFLKVSGVNENPTFFKFTNQTKYSFTCENLKNEFPTKIKYFIMNDTLKAKVSNDEFSIDFEFVKQQKLKK